MRHQVHAVAGVAPGLDFDFQHLPNGPDFYSLLDKCRRLIEAGAPKISLLLDDIDEDFAKRSDHFESEGLAHASLANALSDIEDEQHSGVKDMIEEELMNPKLREGFMKQQADTELDTETKQEI